MFNLFKRKPKKESDVDLFVRAIATGSSNAAITGQEADGQKSFVMSDTLPTEMNPQDRAVLKAAGVVFGDVVEGDPLFQYVQLPKGWTKSATDHSMHNDLLDEKGRKRAGIFYKAAFYDRRANLYCTRRFMVSLDYDKLETGIAEAIVTDCDKEIHRTAPITFDSSGDYDLRTKAQNQAIQDAESWLQQNYPEWKNVDAYWD